MPEVRRAGFDDALFVLDDARDQAIELGDANLGRRGALLDKCAALALQQVLHATSGNGDVLIERDGGRGYGDLRFDAVEGSSYHHEQFRSSSAGPSLSGRWSCSRSLLMLLFFLAVASLDERLDQFTKHGSRLFATYVHW